MMRMNDGCLRKQLGLEWHVLHRAALHVQASSEAAAVRAAEKVLDVLPRLLQGNQPGSGCLHESAQVSAASQQHGE